MPSPVAHSLVGIIGYFAVTSAEKFKSITDILKEDYRKILFFIFLSNVPDLDIVFGFLFYGDLHTFHGQIGHSLLAAIFIASITALAYLIQGSRWKTFLIALILIISHDLMDFSASPDLSKPGTGVWLFFPLQERIASPFPLFYGFQHQTFEQLLGLRNLRVIGLEILEFGILAVIIFKLKRRFYVRRNPLN